VGHEALIFANFQWIRLWVLEVLILLLQFPENGSFQPEILHFWMKIFRTENFWTIFRQPEI